MQRILAILALFALLAAPAQAVVVSRVTTFEAGTPIESDDMNAELDNIIDALNGNLGLDNIVAGAIATANIATAAVTADKINASAVTTTKIASGAVTRAKMEDVGQQISSSSGTARYATPNEALIANLTASLTTTGRPVWVGLQAAGGTTSPGRVNYHNTGGGATDSTAMIVFKRASATINQAMVGARQLTTTTDDVGMTVPCSTFWFLDTPAAGSNSYEAWGRIATGDSGMLTVENCKLVVFEL